MFQSIPKAFAYTFMFLEGKIPRSTMVTLYAPHGRNFKSCAVEVRGYYNPNGDCYNIKFTSGFREFVQACSIKEGTLCTFELTGTDPILSFKVLRFIK